MKQYNRILISALAAAALLTGCSGGSDHSAASSPAAAPQPSVSVQPAVSQPAQLPDPEPAPEPEPAPQEEIGWNWFDDAVMVGDSVSLKLKNHVSKARQTEPDYFGLGQFLTSGSLGTGNALWEVSDKSVHPSFQGEKMLLEASIPMTGAKKVYMMLGINDIAVYGIDGAIQNYATLLDNISAAAPDVTFYIQSATPICEGAEKGALTNANLEIYNQKLEEMCLSRGIPFVDVASVMRDENGFLIRSYCSDPDGMGIHLTDEGCLVWLNYLMEDAAN